MLSTVATAQTAAPLLCEDCRGCSRCSHGVLSCTLCKGHEPAVRLAPCGDPVCAACGEQSDRDYAAYLASERASMLASEIERDALDRAADTWADIEAGLAAEAVR